MHTLYLKSANIMYERLLKLHGFFAVCFVLFCFVFYHFSRTKILHKQHLGEPKESAD